MLEPLPSIWGSGFDHQHQKQRKAKQRRLEEGTENGRQQNWAMLTPKLHACNQLHFPRFWVSSYLCVRKYTEGHGNKPHNSNFIQWKSCFIGGRIQKIKSILYGKCILKWIITIFHLVFKPHRSVKWLGWKKVRLSLRRDKAKSVSTQLSSNGSYLAQTSATGAPWFPVPGVCPRFQINDLDSWSILVTGSGARNHTKTWPSSQATNKNVVLLLWGWTPLANLVSNFLYSADKAKADPTVLLNIMGLHWWVLLGTLFHSYPQFRHLSSNGETQ